LTDLRAGSINPLSMKPKQNKAGKGVSPTSRSLKAQARAVSATAQASRILVPVDFSEPSMGALRTAVSFARLYGGRITLLHVIQPPAMPRLWAYPQVVKMGIISAQLSSQLTALGRKHIDAEHFDKALVPCGEPFDEIVKAARALKTDLIIMATRGRTGMKHLFLGSTAERVIRYAPCGVLTIHGDQKQGWPAGKWQSGRA
jgi:universal stress protein A